LPVAQLQPIEYVRRVKSDQSEYSQSESLEYTRWLATNHYENFHVVSFLLPKELHQDFYNVYSFCRWADDLGDELSDPQESMRLLGWWRDELNAMYQGRARHPVFVALEGTVQRRQIPIEPFDRLIQAFEQDQSVTRYASFEDLFDYCSRSANPVGHLVLYLCGYHDQERQRLSDYTCTALQLANFWQDVTVDLQKDRVYLPLQLLANHGYTLEELFALKFNQGFEGAMREAVDVAGELFKKGLPLIPSVNRRLALDLELFSRGGMKILQKIRAQGYDVLKQRPHISKAERVALMIRCLPRLLPF
jgi:squalene synthase HpnC